MKILLTFLFLSLGFSFSYGQSIIIPHLKEDRKIDSLIDIILKSKAYKKKAKSTNEIFLTGVLVKRNGNSLYFSLQIHYAKSANVFVNGMERRGGSLGCFNYKDVFTILWTSDKFVDLFYKTGEYKVYADIYKLEKSSDVLDYSHNGKSWHYLYKNKHIIRDNN